MRNGKLQYWTGTEWAYVFCHNPLTGIVTTAHKTKALDHRDAEYFARKFGNDRFAVEHRDGTRTEYIA